MPFFYPLLIALLLPLGPTDPTDGLLQSVPWRDTERGLLLRFTPDGTFEYDYGAGERGRYLMGRYTLSADDQEITLGVDYFLGRRRLHPRYRREQDFYLPYAILRISPQELLLQDLVTQEQITYVAAPEAVREDPAERQLPKPKISDLKLPGGWGG